MPEKCIQAPWRSGFILGKKEKGCVFCRLGRIKKPAFRNLILYRGETHYIVMNKYPYNGGHLLIVPYRHVGLLERLTESESLEMMKLCQLSLKVMKLNLKPGAFNLGMNLGRSAGAGIPRHLHIHLVPRWQGDANFMPIVGKTRVHSLPMKYIYDTLAKGFAAV